MDFVDAPARNLFAAPMLIATDDRGRPRDDERDRGGTAADSLAPERVYHGRLRRGNTRWPCVGIAAS